MNYMIGPEGKELVARISNPTRTFVELAAGVDAQEWCDKVNTVGYDFRVARPGKIVRRQSRRCPVNGCASAHLEQTYVIDTPAGPVYCGGFFLRGLGEA